MQITMKIGLAAIVTMAALALTGCSLYHNIFDVKDGGGGMTNPDAAADGKELVEFVWVQNSSDNSKTFSLEFYVEDEQPSIRGYFSDRDSGERIENDKDASSNAIPWTINWVQWFDLQHVLAETKLPEYIEPSVDKVNDTLGDMAEETTEEIANENVNETSEENANDTTDEIADKTVDETTEENANANEIANETDSIISIVWNENGAEQTVILDGSNADTLEEYVLNLAKEAHDSYLKKS